MLLNTYRNSQSGNGHQCFDQYQNYRHQHRNTKWTKLVRLNLFSQKGSTASHSAANVDSRPANLAVMNVAQ